MAIYFYYVQAPYGALSGWSPDGFTLDGQDWATLEHFYQAQKFEDPAFTEQIRLAPTPRTAKQLGSQSDWPLRTDWEEVKDGVMLRGALAKAEAHATVRDALLASGDEELVENSRTDFYWGCGADGTGRNQLGKTWMQVRAVLAKRAA